MQRITGYFLWIIATPLVSEIPFHILELVDEEDAATVDPESQSEQRDLEPVHDDSAEGSFGRKDPEPHFSTGNHGSGDPHDGNTAAAAAAAMRRNTSDGTMAAVVAILLLHMLWLGISFTWAVQLSNQTTLIYWWFYWIMTLGTAGRLLYALSACVRFFVHVFRPRWLPEGVTTPRAGA
ncbi:hypothetical protein CLCR_07669 [Cladophialophora carrionii]|uniref:Uncharacterized protein n=1 Tax=Cladophialophora carrionii TaxID=86049 RepID=A0A1C1CNT8_9EURO|nr:hypothetical protein CLCR_07669 [Cladophialophora carrionii]